MCSKYWWYRSSQFYLALYYCKPRLESAPWRQVRKVRWVFFTLWREMAQWDICIVNMSRGVKMIRTRFDKRRRAARRDAPSTNWGGDRLPLCRTHCISALWLIESWPGFLPNISYKLHLLIRQPCGPNFSGVVRVSAFSPHRPAMPFGNRKKIF